MVNYQEGENQIKVVAKSGKQIVTDEITQLYQTAKWGKPARLTLEKIKDDDGKITIEAKLLDANGVLCLDANNYVYFGLTGDGKLIDNQGTSSGARKVQLYNGRATISLYSNNGKNVASVKSDSIQTQFLSL
jgi:beta-galactosidase